MLGASTSHFPTAQMRERKRVGRTEDGETHYIKRKVCVCGVCMSVCVCVCERERERERERESVHVGEFNSQCPLSHKLCRFDLHGVHGLQCFMY